MSKKSLSLLRNLAHTIGGALIAQPDHTMQTLGLILASAATVFSQKNTKPPTGAVPVKIRYATGVW